MTRTSVTAFASTEMGLGVGIGFDITGGKRIGVLGVTRIPKDAERVVRGILGEVGRTWYVFPVRGSIMEAGPRDTARVDEMFGRTVSIVKFTAKERYTSTRPD